MRQKQNLLDFCPITLQIKAQEDQGMKAAALIDFLLTMCQIKERGGREPAFSSHSLPYKFLPEG